MTLPIFRLFHQYWRKIRLHTGDDEIFNQMSENLIQSNDNKNKFNEGFVQNYGGLDPDNKIKDIPDSE